MTNGIYLVYTDFMNTLIQSYIESKKLAWSPSTLRSEEYRLRAVNFDLLDKPQEQYEHLAKTLKPYALKTMFIRLVDFYEFLARGPNVYRAFMKTNARLFKHAYKKEKLEVTYEEAVEKINRIENLEAKEIALFYLKTGLRFCELQRIEDGSIVGKGGYRRRLLIPAGLRIPTLTMSYSSFRSHLNSVGLKCHTLRKLYANKLIRSGRLEQADVMEAMGWVSVQTVASYQQALKTDDLAATVAQVVGL